MPNRKVKYTIEEIKLCKEILDFYKKWDETDPADKQNKYFNSDLRNMLYKYAKEHGYSLLVQIISSFCVQWSNDLFDLCKAVVECVIYDTIGE